MSRRNRDASLKEEEKMNALVKQKDGTRGDQATFEAQSLREKYPTMPLEYMLKVLNDDHQPKAR
jgi:hypothetical protein